ncbi:MAG: hypothetical protein LIP03_03805 [Bacteroidales bacterium]|nr:hypothetical protein [Bacteroidales bacterium]
MRKYLRSACAMALAALTIGSAAQTRLVTNPAAEDGANPKLAVPSAKAWSQSKAPAVATATADRDEAKAKGVTEFILVDEDFSKLTLGTPDDPFTTNSPSNEYMDMDNLICSYYVTPPGVYIDDSLTQQPGWSGDFAYQAGGTVLLYGQNGSYSFINTPLGDYSGDVTVSLKARAFKSSYVTSEIDIYPLIGGLLSPDYAVTDDPEGGYEFRLREEEGWVEMTYTFRNYSADAGGHIRFLASGAVEFDWIKVTVNPSDFLAEAKINDITDVTNDSFTINWDPVDRAFGYRIWLYKMVQLSDEDAEYSEDFEGANPLVGTDWTYELGSESGVVDGIGNNGSKGLRLYNGDVITAPDKNAKFHNILFYLQASSSNGALHVDLKKDGKWIEDYAYLDAYWFTTGEVIDFDYEMWGAFADKYEGFRIWVKGMPEGEYFVIDDLYATTYPASELQLQCLWEEFADEPDLMDYWYGDVTGANKVCKYTFTNLDPLGDYYYEVESQRIYLFSDKTLHHANVVAAPALLEATDIDSRGSYVANWEKVEKATSYRAINYGAIVAEKAGMMTVLEEDFSKIDSSVTTVTDFYNPQDMNNYWGDLSLDPYTTLPGWSGCGTSLCQSGLGVVTAFYTEAYLYTPDLYLANNDWIRLTLRAYGTPDGDLTVAYGDVSVNLTFDDRGMIDGYIDLNMCGKDKPLRFYASDYGAFVLDYVKVQQEVEAGAACLSYLSDVTVDADTFSVEMENLDDTGYDNFAFAVVALLEKNGETIESSIDTYMLVDLINEESHEMNTPGTNVAESLTFAAESAVEEVARYSIDGTQVGNGYRGIVIIRYSDGTSRKALVK